MCVKEYSFTSAQLIYITYNQSESRQFSQKMELCNLHLLLFPIRRNDVLQSGIFPAVQFHNGIGNNRKNGAE